MAAAAAVILAGGRGERLGGVIKANLEVGGARLIERVAAAVRAAAPVLVATGPFTTAELPLPPGLIAVADRSVGGGGPLDGLTGAMAWLAETEEAPDFLLSVAVDTPFFPAAFLSLASERIRGRDAVVARFAGQDYPTNALWRWRALAPHLPAARSLKGLLERIGTAVLEWSDKGLGNPFANANTPQELAALRLRAAGDFGVGKESQTR